VLRPVLAAEAAIARRVVRVRGEEATDTGESVLDELSLSSDSNGEPLDEREARMIRGVVGLDQTTAREIMVPRVDMVAVELGAPLIKMIDQMLQSGHSRLPVHAGDLDHIEGIVYSRDLLGLLSRKAPPPQALDRDVIRSALFIPENKTLEELLNEFQERQLQIAIVVDEYGGVAGLVTIEDLLEEIVGEIHDEFDVDEPEIEVVSDREFLMDARVGIDQLFELLQVSVEGDGFDTVGGFVYERLGRIPSSGDVVEYDGLVIEVVSTVGRRLKKLRVTKTGEDQQ
jgi:CBS domain containing-hemolysin-like protein